MYAGFMSPNAVKVVYGCDDHLPNVMNKEIVVLCTLSMLAAANARILYVHLGTTSSQCTRLTGSMS